MASAARVAAANELLQRQDGAALDLREPPAVPACTLRRSRQPPGARASRSRDAPAARRCGAARPQARPGRTLAAHLGAQLEARPYRGQLRHGRRASRPRRPRRTGTAGRTANRSARRAGQGGRAHVDARRRALPCGEHEDRPDFRSTITMPMNAAPSALKSSTPGGGVPASGQSSMLAAVGTRRGRPCRRSSGGPRRSTRSPRRPDRLRHGRDQEAGDGGGALLPGLVRRTRGGRRRRQRTCSSGCSRLERGIS